MTELYDARTYLRLPLRERMLASSEGLAPSREEVIKYRRSVSEWFDKLQDTRQQQTKWRLEQVVLEGIWKMSLSDGKFGHNFLLKGRDGKVSVIRIKTAISGKTGIGQVEEFGGDIWDTCIRTAASWEERHGDGHLTPTVVGAGYGRGCNKVAIEGTIHTSWSSQAFSDVAGAIHGDFIANHRRGGVSGYEFAVYSD